MEKINSKILWAGIFVISFSLIGGTIGTKAAVDIGNYANLTANSTEVLQALREASAEIQKMEKAGFNTTRVNDELLEAKQLFEVQLAIEQKTNSSDFSVVRKKVDFIKLLAKKSFEVSDELIALERRVNESMSFIDAKEPLELYKKAQYEFESERYEEALSAIDETYKRISELEAEKTRTGAIVTATRGFFERIIDAWKEVLIGISAIIIAVILLYDRVFAYFITRKTQRLELEKKTITDLIKKTEEDYFEKGNLSETSYHIKMNKFGELIRDINRQIPLLREQLEGHKGLIARLRKEEKPK